MTSTIRDLREQKRLSQFRVSQAAELGFGAYVRIESGGKTTPEEVARVLGILKSMEPGTRKMAGRPFKDPAKQAAVAAARERGESVAAVLGGGTPPAVQPEPTAAPEIVSETPQERKARKERERRAAKKAAASDLL